jgi:hypothetical protein
MKQNKKYSINKFDLGAELPLLQGRGLILNLVPEDSKSGDTLVVFILGNGILQRTLSPKCLKTVW